MAFLARPAAHGGAGPVERVDTHISRVFLAGERVLKLKRARRLPYLDYSTREKRHAACDAEIAVNRRTAPDLYLGVEPVVRRDGRLAVGGEGEILDWVVVMRRFDQSLLYDRMAERGELGEADVVAAAAEIARFHGAAERAAGGASLVARIIDGNRDSTERAAVPRPLSPARAAALHAGCRQRLAALSAVLDARGRAGFVRDGHGDLHLRNIFRIGGKPVLFDAIEFDPAYRRVDVFYDFAFLLMDLLHRGLSRHANLALETYVGATGDAGGTATLPLFLAMRGVIRGHITATIAGGRTPPDDAPAWAEAEAYFALAERALAPPAAALIAVGGLSGTGKTTLARAVAPRFGAMPGALVLRSDILRKRLAGVPAEQRLPESCYTTEWTQRVYDELLRAAEQALAGGHSVIADAVSGDAGQRAALAAVARRSGARFLGVWLDAPLAVREARVSARRADASDADRSIARRQHEPEGIEWWRIDAGRDAAATVAHFEEAMAAAGIDFART